MATEQTTQAQPDGKPTGFQRVMSFFHKNAPPELIAEIVKDGLGKSEIQSSEMGGAPFVEDRWQDGKKTMVPTRREINTGPAQHASGGNAPKMVSEYADPDAQQGAQRAAERLGEMLEGLRGEMKSRFDFLAAENAFMKSATLGLLERYSGVDKIIEAAVAKALQGVKVIKAEKDEKEEEHEEEGKDEEKAKAKALRADARKTFETAKAGFVEVDALVKGAKPALANLRQVGAIADLAKALTMAKAAVELDAASDFGPALVDKIEAYAKSRKLNPDNQNTWPDEGGKKDDRKEEEGHAKATDMVSGEAVLKALGDIKANVEKSLSGQGMLEMNINQLYDTILASSRKSGGVPNIPGDGKAPDLFALMKSNPEGVALAKSAELAEAHQKGELSFEEFTQGKRILQGMQAATCNAITPDIPARMIEVAPAALKKFFPLPSHVAA